MSYIHAGIALLPDGWADQVRIGIEAGRIESIHSGVPALPDDERHAVVIPGMPNLHSHAFQRGMAGLAEVRGPSADSFWTWREAMYRFALSMTPDQLEAIASQLYVEMLEAGFTRVGEFHYLHHDRDGQPFADIAEMATRIAAASARAGIGLTLLPVFYAHAGFGGSPPSAEQRRFTNDPDRFARLLDASRTAVADLEFPVVGVAPHSLRAVTPHELDAVCAMAPEGPIHIHIAEQQREVEDCLAWSGSRPVEWLLDHTDLDDRWCLVHATHMVDDEVERLARSGAIAGLCPITEANLGDGAFAAPSFVTHGGRYGIGSDSNIFVSVPGELRQLEYSQRLAHNARNVMATSGGSSGRALFDAAVKGGRIALGVPAGGLVAGSPADFVSLVDDVQVEENGDRVLDRWIFAQGIRVDDVWAAGRKVVSDGRHVRRKEVFRDFRRVMRTLLSDEEG